MKYVHSQESGRSMIEMLGVLAIIGVLSVGGIAGYSQAMNKFKVTKTTDQIQTMVTNIRTLFASQKSYISVSTADADVAGVMYSVGILTDENCPGGGTDCATPVNPYDGTIVLGSMGTNNKHFYVSYQGLPADACVRLATQSWGDSSSGLIGVGAYNVATAITADPAAKAAAGNQVNLAKDAATDTAGVPMLLGAASTGCGVSGTTSQVTLFYK